MKRTMAGAVSGVFLAVAALSLAMPQGASAVSYTYGYENLSDGTYNSYSSSDPVSPVSHGTYTTTTYPFSGPTHVTPTPLSSPTAGYSYDATQTLRAYAEATAGGGDGDGLVLSAVTKSNPSFTNRLSVLAGTSGLTLGAPVTLSLSISMDGVLRTGTNLFPMDQNGNSFNHLGVPIAWGVSDPAVYQLATVDVSGMYRITDPNRLVCGEGCQPERVVSFGAGGRQSYDAKSWEYVRDSYSVAYPWWIDQYDPTHDGTNSWYWDLGWSLNSNTGASLNGRDQESSGPVESTAFNTLYAHDIGHVFDTGLQTISFNTYIGAELDINGSLDVFSQAYGDYLTIAYGDFMNTFGANITSLTSGVQLAYANSAPTNGGGNGEPSQVPEPSTMMLLGSGLAGLVAARRYFKA